VRKVIALLCGKGWIAPKNNRFSSQDAVFLHNTIQVAFLGTCFIVNESRRSPKTNSEKALLNHVSIRVLQTCVFDNGLTLISYCNNSMCVWTRFCCCVRSAEVPQPQPQPNEWINQSKCQKIEGWKQREQTSANVSDTNQSSLELLKSAEVPQPKPQPNEWIKVSEDRGVKAERTNICKC